MVQFRMLGDRGNSFLAYTQAAVSGGQLVKAMSKSAISSDDPSTHIEVDLCDAAGDEILAAGIALTTAGSGNPVTVATEGLFEMKAGGNITVGAPVGAGVATSADAVLTLKAGSCIGKALTTAASGENVLVLLRVGAI